MVTIDANEQAVDKPEVYAACEGTSSRNSQVVSCVAFAAWRTSALNQLKSPIHVSAELPTIFYKFKCYLQCISLPNVLPFNHIQILKYFRASFVLAFKIIFIFCKSFPTSTCTYCIFTTGSVIHCLTFTSLSPKSKHEYWMMLKGHFKSNYLLVLIYLVHHNLFGWFVSNPGDTLGPFARKYLAGLQVFCSAHW